MSNLSVSPAQHAPAARLRAVLYLRQSIAREESISLELQETAGRSYCDSKGYEVVAVEADPGVSGRTWKRPAVQRVMEMVEQRQADVIVLWKWSRLSRNRLDWAIAVDKVEGFGGRIESATEPLDTSTATGRFARGMLAEFAAFESERIGDGWRETHERRVRSGLPHSGRPRFGYEYDRDARAYRPHPIEGPVLAELYERFIAGDPMRSIIEWLNEGPTTPAASYSTSDGSWSRNTIMSVLASGFGAGLVRFRGEHHPGAHEPVIDQATWQRYQEVRAARARRDAGSRSEHLLSGIIWCWCGSRMVGSSGGGIKTYRCSAVQQKGAHRGNAAVSANVVERAVWEWLLKLRDDLNARAAALSRSKKPRPVENPTAPLIAAQRKAQGALDRLTEQFVEGTIPRSSYERLRDKYLAELRALDDELQRLEVREPHAAPPAIDDVLAFWPRMSIPRRREALRLLIDRVEVYPQRYRSKVTIRSPFTTS